MRYLMLLAVLGVATPAVADHVKSPETMSTDDCSRARKLGKTCVLEIAAEDIEGSTPTSGDIALTARLHATAGSLIRVRREFIVEILRSAEDLD
ncbi:MAG: hypothetical protein AB7O24_11260 [Kofleriaceae bacterium]